MPVVEKNVIPMSSVVSLGIFYLEQMQKNGRIKNVVIPEGCSRESVVINRIFLICYNNGSPSPAGRQALGDDWIKEKIRRKANANDRSSWG